MGQFAKGMMQGVRELGFPVKRQNMKVDWKSNAGRLFSKLGIPAVGLAGAYSAVTGEFKDDEEEVEAWKSGWQTKLGHDGPPRQDDDIYQHDDGEQEYELDYKEYFNTKPFAERW